MVLNLPAEAYPRVLSDVLDLAEQIGKEADAKDLEIARLRGELEKPKEAAAPVLPFQAGALMDLLGDLQTNGYIPSNVDLLKVASVYQSDPTNIFGLIRSVQFPVPADGRPFGAYKESSANEVVDPDGWLTAIRR